MKTIEEIRVEALNQAGKLENIWTAKDLIREAIAIESYIINHSDSKELTKDDLYGPL